LAEETRPARAALTTTIDPRSAIPIHALRAVVLAVRAKVQVVAVVAVGSVPCQSADTRLIHTRRAVAPDALGALIRAVRPKESVRALVAVR